MRSLSESSLLRYTVFSALYIAQGLPEGLLIFAIPPWLATNGLSASEIGVFLGVTALPWSFKLIHAPIMDRFSFLPMGRRRPWILAAQVSLVLSLLSVALIPDPVHHLGWLTAVMFMVQLFSSIQDVSVDGMAIDLLPENQQARANGLMWGSRRIGLAASAAISGWILNTYGLGNAVYTLASLLFIIMMIPLFLRERPGERMMPWTQGQTSKEVLLRQPHNWRDIFRSIVHVVLLPTSLFMGVAVFFGIIGEGLYDALMPVLTVQELGWSPQRYSQFTATANLTAGLFGVLIAGALVDTVGKIRMIRITLLLLILLNATIGTLQVLWSNQSAMVVYLIAYQCFLVMFSVAVNATAMVLCWKRISATQFTLYMVIANLGYSAGSTLLGPVSSLGYTAVFICIAGVCTVMFFLLFLVDLKAHASRIESLDRRQEVLLNRCSEGYRRAQSVMALAGSEKIFRSAELRDL